MDAIALKSGTGLEQIERVSLPDSQTPLSKGQVRLRFIAGSLNHLDLWVAKGLPILSYEFPHVLGADFFGEVLETASPLFREKDRVIVFPAEGSERDRRDRKVPINLSADFGVRGESRPGVFREELIVSDRFVFRAPAHLKKEEAGALPLVYLTAWQMVVEKAGLGESDLDLDRPLLVHAAGSGVTSAILDLLLSFGYRSIAVTSRDADKLEFWRAKGIQTFLESESLESEVKKWARPEVVFDHLGGAPFERGLRLLQSGGKLITCGSTISPQTTVDLRQVFFRQLHVLGSTMGSVQGFRAVLGWVELKKLQPLVDRTMPWTEPLAAFKALSQGAQKGKIVLLR